MKELISTISKKEWKFVLWFSLAIIFITSLPYAYAYFNAPAGTFYNGLHSLSAGDVPVYYSYINQVRDGEFFIKNLLTSEPQDVGIFNVWWSLVGLFASAFKLSNILAFQLSRILMIPIFMVVAYVFLANFFVEEFKRKVALFFIIFSSGVGFYFAIPIHALNLPLLSDAVTGIEIYQWPIDLWITEAVIFSALFHTSHFIASITLTLLIFLLFIFSFKKNKFSYAIWAGLLSLFYFNFHPYYLPTIFGTVGFYLLLLMIQRGKFLWSQAGYLVTAFIISLPSVFYHIWLIGSSPVIAQRALQNITTISPLLFVLIGYGFLIPGFILGLYFLIKNKKFNNNYLFLLIWLGVNVVLIYSPFPFHSRYTQGIQLILAIFSVSGLFASYNFLKNKLSKSKFDFWLNNPTLIVMLFVLLFSPSIIFSVGRDFNLFSNQNQNITYMPNDFYKATNYLSKQPLGQVVLAGDISSKFIPSMSKQFVYAGHGHETLYHASKLARLLNFYEDNNNLESKKRFLANEKINYVLFGEYEKELGGFNPSSVDFLELVFDSTEVKLYKVVATE